MPSVAELHATYQAALAACEAASIALREAVLAETQRLQLGRRDAAAVIRRVVAQHYGVTLAEIDGRDRSARLAEPRMVAMYFCVEMAPVSPAQLGVYFARDRGTILYAHRAIRERRANDHAFSERLRPLDNGLALSFALPV